MTLVNDIANTQAIAMDGIGISMHHDSITGTS